MKYTINSKKGFYICDPCYVLKEDDYDNIWGGQYNYEDGEIPVGDTNFAVVGTGIGDGCFDANYNTKSGFVEVLDSIWVDSGTIAIIPVEICDPDGDVIKIKFDYVGEVSIEYDDGRIYVEFGEESVMIDIDGDPWEDADYDEDDDVDPFDNDLFD